MAAVHLQLLSAALNRIQGGVNELVNRCIEQPRCKQPISNLLYYAM